ncbi:MAG: polyribonucleotide nucleotidyltransferase [Fidelibacterota bacterium]
MIKHEIEIGGRTLSLSTGHVARQSAGAVLVTYGETTVLTAVNASNDVREDIDYFPLQVEYRERQYAGGKIPGGFFKREARPSEKEVLTSRLTDRPIRPLFPKNFRNETQVIITALASDGVNSADILAGIGASAALMISDIPWNGPIATVRVGRIDGELVINPTIDQLDISELELVVSGNEKSVVMVEGEAHEIPEKLFVEALEFAHASIREIIELQKRLIADCEVQKRPLPEVEEDKTLKTAVLKLIEGKLAAVVENRDKISRETEIDHLIENTIQALEEDYPEREQEIKNVIMERIKEDMRERILTAGVRLDGRSTRDIRPISIEAGFLPRTHGSALFTRGETQALAVLTLGSKRDEQIVDDMENDHKKNYMLHYNFPPYSVGEVGRIGFTSRREIGHGHLAERALKPVLPDYEEFPYTIRIVSEILESNGSSSMASVCGGSLCLMDAGVPTKGHVAGIAMGLIYDDERYAILSDILGAEDHLGDMDFKVAGTRQGITAIQLDLKIEGISVELLQEALEQAREGRYHILDLMEQEIAEPRPNISPYAPRIMSLQIDTAKIGELIGPGGKTIKKIIADTECSIEVDDDGTVTISGQDEAKCRDAMELVRAITMEPEIGMVFDAVVTRIMSFGAFVEFAPGREGMVHISELDWNRTDRVEDVVKPGDTVKVKLIRVDDQGRYDFSMKVLMPKPDNYRPPQRRPHRHHGDRQHKRPFRPKRY